MSPKKEHHTHHRLVGFVVFAALAAACAAPAPSAPSSPVPAATVAPTEAPQAKATSAPEPTAVPPTAVPESTDKNFKGQLIVSVNGANPDLGQFKGLVEAYKKVQPDVEVIIEGPPSGTEYATWLGTQLAAGDVRPDIVSGNYQPSYAKYVNLDKYRFQTNPHTGKTWDEDLDWNFFGFGTPRIMLATEAVHVTWVYNKDLLDKVGIAAAPQTFNEFVAACDKLKAAGITPIGANFAWQLPQWFAGIWWDQYNRKIVEQVRAQPGDFNFDDDKDGAFKFDVNDRFMEGKYTVNNLRLFAGIRDGKIRFDTPEMADFIGNMAKVFPRCASPNLFVESGAYYSEFLQQQVAMIAHWSVPVVANDMASMDKFSAERLKDMKIEDAAKLKSFNWGTFNFPSMEGSLVQAPARGIESATGVYGSIIDKNSAQTELAVDFLTFWFSQPGYQAYVNSGLADTKTPYVPGGPIMVRGVKLTEELQKQMDSIVMVGNAENGLNTWWLGLPGENLYKQSLNNYKDALEGKITPEEFGKRQQALWTDNFPEILTALKLTNANLDNPARDPAAQ